VYVKSYGYLQSGHISSTYTSSSHSLSGRDF